MLLAIPSEAACASLAPGCAWCTNKTYAAGGTRSDAGTARGWFSCRHAARLRVESRPCGYRVPRRHRGSRCAAHGDLHHGCAWCRLYTDARATGVTGGTGSLAARSVGPLSDFVRPETRLFNQHRADCDFLYAVANNQPDFERLSSEVSNSTRVGSGPRLRPLWRD